MKHIGNKRKPCVLGAGLASVLVMWAPGSIAQTEAGLANQTQAGGLADIVVTARRTSEALQTTPVAVTALTAESLTQRNITDVYGLHFSAPNLSVSPLIFNSGAAVTIRGQVNVENQSNSDPAVAIYVDGVYVARSSGGLMDLVDVERVEVLRGPQGTLFGRNTTGGALNIVTPDPSGTLEGFVTGTIGNYDNLEVLGALNPIGRAHVCTPVTNAPLV